MVFDHFIGDYLIARMVKVFVALYPQHTFEEVAERIQSRFRGIQGNLLDIFPPTIYTFAKRKMIGNEVSLENTGRAPLFR